MIRRLALAAGLLLAAGCSSPLTGVDAYLAAVADLPGTNDVKLTLGQFSCESQVPDLPARMAGEIYTLDQATLLVDSADEWLCQ